MKLRDYQQKTLEDIKRSFSAGNKNLCVVLPTGSGKSHVIAGFCEENKSSRILILTHVKELIEQNLEKLQMHTEMDIGVYSAGIGRKEIKQITIGGIQSVRSRIIQFGRVDFLIIDECHLINHKDSGSYRSVIEELSLINPDLKVLGLTATPFRLGHGLIIEKPAIFDFMICPVSVIELIRAGYLATLRSKITKEDLDVSKVGKRGGEYIESELQKAVDTKDKNWKVVQEIIDIAGDRSGWLLFCTGVNHAIHIKDVLVQSGIRAAVITGDTPKLEREEILGAFKRKEIRAVTNANVLTTGFDYPDIDLIAMLRPTMSKSLYMQMAGRGMRVKSHTDHCLVLDFAGVIRQHGAITDISITPEKHKDGEGIAPVKVCDSCGELCHLSTRICPCCGSEFIFAKKELKKLDTESDIMGGTSLMKFPVSKWHWTITKSHKTGLELLVCSYYSRFFLVGREEVGSGEKVTQRFPIIYDGAAGSIAIKNVLTLAKKAGVCVPNSDSRNLFQREISEIMNKAKPPKSIKFTRNGKYEQVVSYEF